MTNRSGNVVKGSADNVPGLLEDIFFRGDKILNWNETLSDCRKMEVISPCFQKGFLK